MELLKKIQELEKVWEHRIIIQVTTFLVKQSPTQFYSRQQPLTLEKEVVVWDERQFQY